MAIPTPIAQRACERSSDWRRGAAGSPDPYDSKADLYDFQADPYDFQADLWLRALT